ncbi:hypothetical protein CR513_59884, partial [Mucuna pruriens]
MAPSTSAIQLKGHLSSRCHVTPKETCRSSHALVYIGVVAYILGVFQFTRYTLSSFLLPRSHFPPSMVVHGVALVFLSIEEVQFTFFFIRIQQLPSFTAFQVLKQSQSNFVASICTWPRPSLINLYRDHIESVCAKSNSASGRDERLKISDSQWVSPVQVVPKKSGMTVMKNQQDELRVCIDYRGLNQATRKDHFPLPFINQVLKKLSRKSHYCFLDGFSGYMQIHIAPKDQHKTTFTFPFGTFAYTRLPFGLCNASSTFQRCMTSIFSDLL